MFKKSMSFILLLVILFSFTNVYAIDNNNSEDSIVVPMIVSCDYWSDGNHRMQTGESWTEHDYQYEHLHLIYDEYGGVVGSYTDWVCKIYNVTEKYCACGYTTENRVYSRTHCH